LKREAKHLSAHEKICDEINADGLAVGGGAGLGVGLTGRSNDGFEKIENAATAGFAVIGAAGGALAGYLIGRSGRKRVLIYQAGTP
jgi:hypothetical protein